MSKVCSVCGKGHMKGNTISHSHILTNRAFKPNLHKVKVEENGKIEYKYMCTKCMKGSKKDK